MENKKPNPGQYLTFVIDGSIQGLPIGEVREIIVETAVGHVGLIVDQVREVISLRDEDIDPAPGFVNGGSQSLVKGLGRNKDEVIVIISVSEGFSMEDLGKITLQAS